MDKKALLLTKRIPWLAPCSGVTVADFGQLNSYWVLVMLMAKFLSAKEIFD